MTRKMAYIGISYFIGLFFASFISFDLSIFLGIDQKIAQATNLIFFIPTSLAAIYINIKQKKINLKVSKIIIVCGIIGSIIGATIAKNMDIKILKIHLLMNLSQMII